VNQPLPVRFRSITGDSWRWQIFNLSTDL